MNTLTEKVQLVYYGSVVLGSVVVTFRVGWRWLMREIQQRDFVEDVASNHLPHIQHALELIAKKLGIDLGECPPIRYEVRKRRKD